VAKTGGGGRQRQSLLLLERRAARQSNGTLRPRYASPPSNPGMLDHFDAYPAHAAHVGGVL